MTENDPSEVSPVTVMSFVLVALAAAATLTLLITSLYHSSVAYLDKYQIEYKDKVATVYNATHVEISPDPRYRYGDTAVKLVIKGKRYDCVAPATLDLTTGEMLQCSPYQISSAGVESRA